MTSIKDEIVPILRRAIGDNEEPYAYTDNFLADYIIDAINEIRLDWTHGYSVDSDTYTVEPDVENSHQVLFAMKAKLIILSSGSNISFDFDSISVRRKQDDKKRLEKKLNKVVNKLVATNSIGGMITEFDDFDDWFII